MNVQHNATAAAHWFETATKTDGETTYTRLKKDSPDWVEDLVREAHGYEMLPDDWRYDCIRHAVDWIAEENDPDDVGVFADSEVDTYTTNALQWLASHLSRIDYCDQAREELGPFDSIVGEITAGQYMEASEIFSSVVTFLEDLDLEDTETEEQTA